MSRIQEAFDAVRAEPEMKAEARRFVEKQYRAQRRLRPARPLAFAALAAVCMIAVFAACGYLNETVSYVSLDAETSAELCLNRLGRVTDVRTYDEQSRALAETADPAGKDWLEAVSALSGEDTRVTIASKTDGKAEALAEQLGGEVFVSDIQSFEEARSFGMTGGKYAVCRELMACDDTADPESCRNESVTAMLGEIERCHATPEPTPVPTALPTAAPTQAPTAVPTPKPTAVPTRAPTAVPTPVQTAVPTQAPAAVPTTAPASEHHSEDHSEHHSGSHH